MTTEAPRYRFAGADGGVWLGLSRPTVLALAATILLTASLLYAGMPMPVGVVVAAVGVAVALTPVGDRALLQWVTPTARRARQATAGSSKWRSGAYLPQRVAAPESLLTLPTEYGRLQLLDVEAVGVVDDATAGTATVVLATAGHDRFPLLDPTDQARLLAGWGDALASLCADDRLRRVQWIERREPDRRDPARWMTERATAHSEDYRCLADAVVRAAVRHESWVALSYTRSTSTPSELVRTTRETARTLVAADLLSRPLSAVEIATLLRKFVGADEAIATGPFRAGPASRATSWDHHRTDDCYHRSFAVTGWPRVPVTAGWLEPLLLAAAKGTARTVSVHLLPVSTAAALRQSRAARARARLDEADRRRLGLVDSAAVGVAARDAAATEEELIAGFAMHQLSAVVTCSAASLPELEEASRVLRASASAARLDLRACHGEHDRAFVATLPLGRASGGSR